MENCYCRTPSDCKCQIAKEKDFECSDHNMKDCTFYKTAANAIKDYLKCKDPEEPGKLTKTELVKWVEDIQTAQPNAKEGNKHD